MSNPVGFSLLLVSAFAAWGLWLAEVCWIKGWTGLAWLNGFNWSALPICALIVLTVTYFVPVDARWPRRTIFVVVSWVLTVGAFATARWAVFHLFTRWFFPGRAGLGPAIILLLAGMVVSAGLTVATNRWLASVHDWTALLVAAGLLLVVPLSIATIKMFPVLNGSTDEIHSIKMGYPVFWTALLIPVALRLGRRGASEK
jgi:hypothetical protein